MSSSDSPWTQSDESDESDQILIGLSSESDRIPIGLIGLDRTPIGLVEECKVLQTSYSAKPLEICKQMLTKDDDLI
jgi:hypothetical protein